MAISVSEKRRKWREKAGVASAKMAVILPSCCLAGALLSARVSAHAQQHSCAAAAARRRHARLSGAAVLRARASLLRTRAPRAAARIFFFFVAAAHRAGALRLPYHQARIAHHALGISGHREKKKASMWRREKWHNGESS